jgi:hypothetical protein
MLALYMSKLCQSVKPTGLCPHYGGKSHRYWPGALPVRSLGTGTYTPVQSGANLEAKPLPLLQIGIGAFISVGLVGR